MKRGGTRLIAVLPLPKNDYLADFESVQSKGEFVRLLGAADEVIELPPRASRVEAYAAARNAILQQADVILAVWDGQGTGPGRHRRSGCRRPSWR